MAVLDRSHRPNTTRRWSTESSGGRYEAARQRVADPGLATATWVCWDRLNAASQVKVAFYDLRWLSRKPIRATESYTVKGWPDREGARQVGEAPHLSPSRQRWKCSKARQQLARADNLVRISRVAVDTLTGGALGCPILVHGEFRRLPRDLQIEGLMAA